MKTIGDKIILKRKLQENQQIKGLEIPSDNVTKYWTVVSKGPAVEEMILNQTVIIDTESKTVKNFIFENEKYMICKEEDIILIVE